MKLALIQTGKSTLPVIENDGSVDLFVLPEKFGGTLEWMTRVARETNAAVAGSVAVEDGGRRYNRMFFVRPDGSWEKYDKRHLFSLDGEGKAYTAGTERVVVEWRGVRILLQVCYDLRFPVFARNRGDYDMIVYSANWPTVRREAWEVLLRARAIENQCWVAGVNLVGGEYSGGTYLVDYKGNVVASDSGQAEQIVRGEVDMEALRAFRRKFPVAPDADDFVLNI